MKDSGLLTDRSLQGLQYAEQQAIKLSEAAEAAVLTRVETLGFTHSDFVKALAFVRDRAPIVVHLNLSGSPRVPIPGAAYHPVSRVLLLRGEGLHCCLCTLLTVALVLLLCAGAGRFALSQRARTCVHVEHARHLLRVSHCPREIHVWTST